MEKVVSTYTTANKVPVYRVSLVRERSHQTLVCVTEPADVGRIAAEFLHDADREQFVVLLLNSRHRVIGLQVASMGSLNESIVHPREVFKAAILAGCGAIVVAHNHPSGDTNPSSEDVAMTKRLGEAGRLLGIPLLDHVIVGENGEFRSLRETLGSDWPM
ncbi:MAG: JAB domain-containing protein [Firmicutes bacterium]|jgi:DNA repair protein RadC|nr:JAB domain-containing protein [Bacillota bacterium]